MKAILILFYWLAKEELGVVEVRGLRDMNDKRLGFLEFGFVPRKFVSQGRNVFVYVEVVGGVMHIDASVGEELVDSVDSAIDGSEAARVGVGPPLSREVIRRDAEVSCNQW